MAHVTEELDTILIDRDAENATVAVVTLNRPERLNALTPEMGPFYAATLQKLDADPSVRAIVVTGAGRGFCSGAPSDERVVLGCLSWFPESLNRGFASLSLINVKIQCVITRVSDTIFIPFIERRI